MFRRISFIFSSLGLSTLFLFILLMTPEAVFARNVTAHTSVIPLTVNTNVICTPIYFDPGWTQTGNGPASFGCGGHAWQINTPTRSVVAYDAGAISSSARYSLRAFITGPADAVVNYDIYIGTAARPASSCVVDQSRALIGWNSVCSITVSANSINQELTVTQWSGQASHRTMSASAIQFLLA